MKEGQEKRDGAGSDKREAVQVTHAAILFDARPKWASGKSADHPPRDILYLSICIVCRLHVCIVCLYSAERRVLYH